MVAALGPPPPPSYAPSRPAQPPLHDVSELHGLVPTDAKQPMDMRALISRLVDGSALHEFKAEYGNTLITGFAHINGYQVCIIKHARPIRPICHPPKNPARA